MSHSHNRIPGGPSARPDADPGVSAAIPPIQSASLLQGRDAITIEHNGRLYQLRRTKQGKLILTK